jgi:AcrR family transcriptional regulator
MQKEEISAQAFKLFRKKGYEGTTVQDICDACGISKPTFYSRFASKGDLIVDFYDGVTERLNANLSSLVETTSAWKQLKICFGTLMDETEAVGVDVMSHMLIINLEQDRHSFDARDFLTRTMVAIIKRGQEMGEIANETPADELYETASHLFQGYLLMWSISKAKLDWRNKFMAGLEALLCVRNSAAS